MHIDGGRGHGWRTWIEVEQTGVATRLAEHLARLGCEVVDCSDAVVMAALRDVDTAKRALVEMNSYLGLWHGPAAVIRSVELAREPAEDAR